jgi:hypothetical protein
MSVAATQASMFYEEIVKGSTVYTFFDQGDYLVYPVSNGEVVPFWSSKSRLEKIQATLPKYSGYEIGSESLESFVSNTVPYLEDNKILFGINWSGDRLQGYNLEAEELRKNIDYWTDKSQC